MKIKKSSEAKRVSEIKSYLDNYEFFDAMIEELKIIDPPPEKPKRKSIKKKPLRLA